MKTKKTFLAACAVALLAVISCKEKDYTAYPPTWKGFLIERNGVQVTRIEEETVSAHPCGILGVKLQILAVEYVDKVSATHGTSRMSALGFLYH